MSVARALCVLASLAVVSGAPWAVSWAAACGAKGAAADRSQCETQACVWAKAKEALGECAATKSCDAELSAAARAAHGAVDQCIAAWTEEQKTHLDAHQKRAAAATPATTATKKLKGRLVDAAAAATADAPVASAVAAVPAGGEKSAEDDQKPKKLDEFKADYAAQEAQVDATKAAKAEEVANTAEAAFNKVPQGNTAAREKAELVAIHQRAEATKAKTEAADAEKTAKDREEEVRLLILLTTTTTTVKPKAVKKKAVHPEVVEDPVSPTVVETVVKGETPETPLSSVAQVEAAPAAAQKALAGCRAHAATLAAGSPERAAADAECAKKLALAKAEDGLPDSTVDTTSSGLYRPPGHNPPRPLVRDETDEEAVALVKAGKRKMPEKDSTTVHHSREAIKLRGAAKNALEKEA